MSNEDRDQASGYPDHFELPRGCLAVVLMPQIYRSSQTRDRTAQNQVRQDRQDDGNDDRFSWINKMQNDELVDDVQHHRENEYLADTLPPILENLGTVGGIRAEAPEVGGLPALASANPPRMAKMHAMSG